MESERLQLINYIKGQLCRVELIHGEIPQEIRAIDPAATPPFLTDKSLYLVTPHRLEEFFEERFPGVPLLPTDPVSRAKVRTLADEIRSWYDLEKTYPTRLTATKLVEFASALDPDTMWFTGPEISRIDIAIAPLLLRQSVYGVINEPNSPFDRYQQRITSLLREALDADPIQHTRMERLAA